LRRPVGMRECRVDFYDARFLKVRRRLRESFPGARHAGRQSPALPGLRVSGSFSRIPRIRQAHASGSMHESRVDFPNARFLKVHRRLREPSLRTRHAGSRARSVSSDYERCICVLGFRASDRMPGTAHARTPRGFSQNARFPNGIADDVNLFAAQAVRAAGARAIAPDAAIRAA
jgi:hypothetical protein